MTYTNGYQPNTGPSTYSPFNRSSSSQYQGYPDAVQGGPQQFPSTGASPALGNDNYLAPSNNIEIDTLSSNIDQKIAQIRAAFAGPATPAAPAMSGAAAAPQVSQADLDWAMALEAKVREQQYQPTQEETARYENIGQRLQAQMAAQQAGQQPAAAPPAAAPAAAQVPEADLQWAMQLESKVREQQYQPTQQETARYEDIARRLQAQMAAQQGGQQPPAPTAAAPAAAQVPEADLQWAMQLESKVREQQYQPTQQETARYEDIARRLQAQMAAQQGGQQPPAPTAAAPTGQTGPRNWAQWGQPFTVPAAPNMPLPIAGPNGQPSVTVPTSLRNATRSTPAQVLNQPPGQQVPASLSGAPQAPMGPQAAPQNPQAPQGGQRPLPPNVSQQEVDWALQFEALVQQGHQPTPQQLATYQSIADRLQAGMQGQAAPQQVPPQQAPQQMPPQQMPPQQQQQVAPQQFAQPPQQQAQGLPPGVSQQELEWATQLEQRVQSQNYQPNPQELATYQSIANRLQQAIAAQQQGQVPQQQAGGVNPMTPGPQQVMPAPPQPVQLVAPNYPTVQATTPQYPVPPTPFQPQPTPQGQQQFPQQAPNMPPGQSPHFPPQGQQQAQGGPSFWDKAKAAWGVLWS